MADKPEQCPVCNRGFTDEEVRKQVTARHPEAISRHKIASVHEGCLESYEQQMAQEHGADWKQKHDIEIDNAYKIGLKKKKPEA